MKTFERERERVKEHLINQSFKLDYLYDIELTPL